ncbi:MAG: tRNA (adenosine(37)-N6)-threonylcarbamoyltransferase complex ATPase subunit type 1 TsaE [Acidimicrobiia bacterium]
MTPIVTQTHGAGETLALAERVGGLLRGGDVLSLSGDLGAGKTVFAKGVARALRVRDAVVSPTFTVVREYAGTLRLVHVDVYRLDRVQELHDVGWDDLLDGDSVALVEWGDRVGPLLPTDRLEVRIDLGDTDDDRTVTFTLTGSAWVVRGDALAAVVGSDEVP